MLKGETVPAREVRLCCQILYPGWGLPERTVQGKPSNIGVLDTFERCFQNTFCIGLLRVPALLWRWHFQLIVFCMQISNCKSVCNIFFCLHIHTVRHIFFMRPEEHIIMLFIYSQRQITLFVCLFTRITPPFLSPGSYINMFNHVHTIPIASMYCTLYLHSVVFFTINVMYIYQSGCKLMGYLLDDQFCKKKHTYEKTTGKAFLHIDKSARCGPECQLLVAHQWLTHRVDGHMMTRVHTVGSNSSFTTLPKRGAFKGWWKKRHQPKACACHFGLLAENLAFDS